jgi:cytoskeletal protein CcmA (bactofilin family)
MLWGSADVYFGMSGNADFEGDLVLGNGILSSSVVKIVGDLASGASVDFTGDNLRGLLRVDGDVSGDIRNIQNIHDIGRLWVLGSLAGTGRILIDGYCDGEIDINDGTVALSQIHIKEGLYDDGTIEINHSGPYFNANGTIYIGEPKGPLGNITFDGSILIQNDEGPSGCDGGELNGDIIVRGCHATNDYLDICPCGGGTGHVDIIQDDCAPQVQGYRCDDFNDCHCQD